MCPRRATRYALHPAATIAGVAGLSDLTRDEFGQFWAVPERSPPGSSQLTREILQLDLGDTAAPRVVARYPYQLPEMVLDTESIASLGSGVFAIGTEVQRGHEAEGSQTSDAVFVVTVDDGRASVKPGAGWDFSYAPWKMKRATNLGIEGMCATPRWVLMVSEQRSPESPAFAPMEVLDRHGAGSNVTGKLWLGHDGAISALTCCETEGALDVMAILRGLGRNGTSTHRLLGFHLTAAGPMDVTPDLDVDLAPLYASAGGLGVMPNIEGLAPLDADSIAIITDDSPGSGARLFMLTASP